MGLRAALRRLVRPEPVPVFVLPGRGARDALRQLMTDDRVRLTESPRSAMVLILLGGVEPGLVRPARQVHDQLPHPRGTVWCTLGEDAGRVGRWFPPDRVVEYPDDLTPLVTRLREDLLAMPTASEWVWLPDRDPAPWRGVGPYGQGGKGMTGGVPYGRPMAGRGPDRDGLELDQLHVRVGPFFPPLPAGLVLELILQGDVVQQARVGPNPFIGSPMRSDVFARARGEAVPLRAIEEARARHHLHAMAAELVVHGLPAMAGRARRMAAAPALPTGDDVRKLARPLERSGGLAWATGGVGVVAREHATAIGGPIGRAAGSALDARTDHPDYVKLGFAPIVHEDGDARARWRQRLAETAQALDLARRAGERLAGPTGVVESPWGPMGPDRNAARDAVALLPNLLAGQEWGDAVRTIVSLDLDTEAAA